MHPFVLPADVVARMTARRGKAHPHDDADPRRTALLVVDMQNGFLEPGTAFALCEAAPAIVPNVNRLAAALRAAGGLVVWVLNTFTPESLVSWSHLHETLTTPGGRAARAAAMAAGSRGHALWAGLETAPGDLFVPKTRFSALIQGSSDLEARLRARGIEAVLVTGCVTNVCCESTARDAMMLNFRTTMVSDANAALSDDAHAASLLGFYQTFGDVTTTDEAVAVIAKHR
jgi:ureidoacrylate peracid hydrolase